MGRTHDLVLGVDLDNVCANYTAGLRRVVAMEHGVDPATLADPQEWNYLAWGLDTDTFDEMHRLAVTKYRMMSWLDPMPGVSEALRRISDKGVRIRIVTHRLYVTGTHAVVGGDTLQWLEDNAIPYWDLAFLARKSDIWGGAGDDSRYLLIDDAPHNLESVVAAAAERGHPDPNRSVICLDWPYNRHLTDLPRARSWAEAENLVDELLIDRDRS